MVAARFLFITLEQFRWRTVRDPAGNEFDIATSAD